MYYLSKELYFPNVAHAHSSWIIALGGDLSSERLQLAYQSGIFPV
jgi:leucyl/phenylalanyl-tRNA--protein transferase